MVTNSEKSSSTQNDEEPLVLAAILKQSMIAKKRVAQSLRRISPWSGEFCGQSNCHVLRDLSGVCLHVSGESG